MRLRVIAAAIGATLVAFSGSAAAQIKIGMLLSTTGPAAALGVPERNTVALMPKKIGGMDIEYIVLDDGTDTTNARRNAEKFVGEHKVDAIIGASTTPNTMAISEFVAKSQTPTIALGGSLVITRPMNEVRKWIFATPYNDEIVMGAGAKHMAATGVKTAAVIAFADALGESNTKEFIKAAEERKIKVVASEKYNPTDTSVTAQILKIVAAKPDAVMIIASGTPAALPHHALVERNYRGKRYTGHGVVTNDFIRVGGKNVEGILVPAGPAIVAEDLPDNHPAKKVAVDYKTRYEAMYGKGTFAAFGANAWDASLVLQDALPRAIATKAKPGTTEFRVALRDAIEATKNLAATHGIVNMGPNDHNGFSADSAVVLTIDKGRWTVAK